MYQGNITSEHTGVVTRQPALPHHEFLSGFGLYEPRILARMPVCYFPTERTETKNKK